MTDNYTHQGDAPPTAEEWAAFRRWRLKNFPPPVKRESPFCGRTTGSPVAVQKSETFEKWLERRLAAERAAALQDAAALIKAVQLGRTGDGA